MDRLLKRDKAPRAARTHEKPDLPLCLSVECARITRARAETRPEEKSCGQFRFSGADVSQSSLRVGHLGSDRPVSLAPPSESGLCRCIMGCTLDSFARPSLSLCITCLGVYAEKPGERLR